MKRMYPDCVFRVSAKAVIIVDSKILLVNEDSDGRELPGGGVEHGEHIEQGLRREIMEEIGAEITDIDYTNVRIWTALSKRNGKDLLFVVHPVTLEEVPSGPAYHDVKIGFFTKEELSDLHMEDAYDNYRLELPEFFN